MNKALAGIIASGIVVGTLWADSITNVYSVNAVGYIRQDVQPESYYLMGCPFDKAGGGTNTIIDLFGDAGNVDGTTIYIFDPVAGAYNEITYYEGLGWGEDGTKGTTVVKRDTGFWYLSKVSQLSLSGEVPGAKASATTDVQVITGYQILTFPYPVATNLVATAPDVNATDGDTIYVWTGGGYNEYTFFDGLGWTLNAEPAALPTMQPGQGFWLYRTGPGYTWSVLKSASYVWP